MTDRPFIAGNWKMHGLTEALREIEALDRSLRDQPARARVAVALPATLIHRAAVSIQGTDRVELAGQDCHFADKGAFTGDVAAGMLHDAGAALVVLGHSERRTAYKEDDALIASKVEAAVQAGLEPIVCVGESLEERKAGRAVEVVTGQVRDSLPATLEGRAFSVAYEPVWAIGTGLTPTTDEIVEVHDAVRAALQERFGEAGARVPILYGGSVKPANAAEILSARNVGGALVGGASLKADDFLQIVRAAG